MIIKYKLWGKIAYMSTLDQEYEYFVKNLEELLKKYEGRTIIIKGDQVLGDYDNDFDAIEETIKEHAVGTFLVQKCVRIEGEGKGVRIK